MTNTPASVNSSSVAGTAPFSACHTANSSTLQDTKSGSGGVTRSSRKRSTSRGAAQGATCRRGTVAESDGPSTQKKKVDLETPDKPLVPTSLQHVSTKKKFYHQDKSHLYQHSSKYS